MKPLFYTFSLLIIILLISSEGIAQQISLSVTAEKNISKTIISDLEIPASFQDYSLLKAAVDAIPVTLQKRGYIESKLEVLQKTNDTTYHASFYFGKKYTYIKVYYSNAAFSKKELQEVASEITDTYFIIPFETAEAALQQLNEIKTARGDAFAKTQLQQISVDGDELSANISLQTGESKTVDAIVVKGYDKFPKSFLKHYAGVRLGKAFSKQKIIEQNNIISNLGFVESIKAPETLFEKDSTTVYFYFEKQKNNLFDGVIGFATDEETNRLQFNGYLDLALTNNLNFGEQLTLNYKADGEDQQNFRVNTKMPYLFNSPIGLELELSIFKRDTSFVTTAQQARVNYQINPAATIFSGYKGYESSNLLDEVVGGIPIEDYKSKFIVLGLSFYKPQNSELFPKKTFITIMSELGVRESKSISEDQQRFSAVANHIINLNYKNSIYLQNTSSILLSDTFLVNELYRFGGINSIRGFDENSIDASVFSVLNTEYRYQFNQGAYLHSIIDLAYFENEVLALKEKLYSFGLGVGLATKAGIFRFNIANGNSESQYFSFNNTKVHLSLSSKF